MRISLFTFVRKNFILLPVFFLFFLVSPAGAKESVNLQEPIPDYHLYMSPATYNKPLSVFLSVISPGLGQIYSGQLNKGLTIWTTSVFLLAGTFINCTDLDFRSVSGPFPFNFGLRFKQQLSQNDLFWTVSLGATYVILYIYSIIDISSYDTSKGFVSVNVEADRISAEYKIPF